jgi:membrane protease YdiL (CAAX protease family)
VTLLPLFLDSHYELRSGWKTLSYAALLVFLYVAWALVLSLIISWFYPALLPTSIEDPRALYLTAIAGFFPAVMALWIMARLVDRAPLSAFGVAVHERWFRDFVVGIAVAAGMLGLTLAGSFAFGDVRIQWGSASLPAFGLLLAVLAVAALNEELVFRGYPLQMLMKGIGPWGAILLISSLFGVVHFRNPGATALSIVNTILAGVLLSLAYWKTRSLWLPWGIHLGWNAGLAIVLGFPVSGLRLNSLLETHVSGPKTILGGSYGPEDGILGTVIFLLGAIVVCRLRVAGVSPKIGAALAAHAGKVYVQNRD